MPPLFTTEYLTDDSGNREKAELSRKFRTVELVNTTVFWRVFVRLIYFFNEYSFKRGFCPPITLEAASQNIDDCVIEENLI
jgi:hypothetical protein